eukprot:scaffold11638_cov118-Isochrysis_galbana.AAC.4
MSCEDAEGGVPKLGVPRVACVVCCLLSVCMCAFLASSDVWTRGRVVAEPHASNAGAWLARVSGLHVSISLPVS